MGSYTDTAQVTSATTDPVPGNDNDSESTIVLPAADMVITKTDGVASIIAGTSTTYTITLTNGGPSTELAGVVVSDTIPAGTTGSESEPELLDRRSDVHVHHDGAHRPVRLGLVPPDASTSPRATQSPTLVNTADDHVHARSWRPIPRTTLPPTPTP